MLILIARKNKMVELDAARASKLRGIKSLSSSSTAVSLFDPRAAAKFGMFGAMVLECLLVERYLP